jgi:hypothetical protein
MMTHVGRVAPSPSTPSRRWRPLPVLLLDVSASEVPDDYITFLIQQKRRDLHILEEEQRRRELLREADLPWVEKLIKAGHHALAQKHHPDRGGSVDDMRAINAAVEQLKEFAAAQRQGAYP